MKEKLAHGRDITLEEVSRHNSHVDAWCVLKEKVYNITSFVQTFPDGADLLNSAGSDATQKFEQLFPGVEVENTILVLFYEGNLKRLM
mmetsp:Transcript_9916/g.8752  ORF Transcript_9916/g.8752 Transcript_9916/m.8752 type:complete len:88 (+) Transcript_9916:1-264(+)